MFGWALTFLLIALIAAALGFAGIAGLGGGSVGVDIINIAGFDACIPEGTFEGPLRAFNGRVRDMRAIG